ncbi:MAG TPA: thioesterase family protein [Gaiellaceae bacterium]|jgi:acyl-CoA thioesterase FadM
METTLETRWTDFDALGHLTHAAYPVFLDEARDRYLQATVGSFTDWPCVVAHVSIDYVRELRYPTPHVVVNTSVVEVGRTSVSFEQTISDGAVTSRSVLVAFDPETRASRPITDAERLLLTSRS